MSASTFKVVGSGEFLSRGAIQMKNGFDQKCAFLLDGFVFYGWFDTSQIEHLPPLRIKYLANLNSKLKMYSVQMYFNLQQQEYNVRFCILSTSSVVNQPLSVIVW